jgi:hypothetical protein
MSRKSIIQNIFVGLAFVCLTASAAFAQATAFTYQGKLTDAGNPANSNYDLQFKLFDTATIGTGAQQGATLVRTPVTASAGVFTVTLDFGANVFDGSARYLEIGVRPADSSNSYTVLAPRQPITSTPYAIQTLNAQQLGGVDASEYVTTTSVGNSFVKNATTQQAGANFNISGNGIIGDSLGIGVAASAGNKLDVAGTARITPGNGGVMQFATPNSEIGMTTTFGTGRADLRFDGATLKLVAGPAGGPPSAANGIAVSTAGNVGIGAAAPSAGGVKLDVLGNVLITQGNGGVMQFYTPNSETGMTTTFNGGRADMRFDGTTLKLVAGPLGGPPPSTNGIIINTSGNVGIGTTNPVSARLQVEGAGGNGVYGNSTSGAGVRGQSAAVNTLTGAGVYGASTGNGGVGVVGEGSGINTLGVFGVSTSLGGIGVYARNLSGGRALYVEGNAGQDVAANGLVKAMIYVQQDGAILRCYNGITNSTTGNCGFVINRTSAGTYNIDFNFQVDNRFIAITARDPDILNTHISAAFRFLGFSNQEVRVVTVITNSETFGDDANFMIIVY